MRQIRNSQELYAAIALLKVKQRDEELILKEQFRLTYENLKPLKIITATVKELFATPDIKTDLLNTSVFLVTGYLSKQLALHSTQNPLKQVLVRILQLGLTGVVSINANRIIAKVSKFMGTLFRQKA